MATESLRLKLFESKRPVFERELGQIITTPEQLRERWDQAEKPVNVNVDAVLTQLGSIVYPQDSARGLKELVNRICLIKPKEEQGYTEQLTEPDFAALRTIGKIHAIFCKSLLLILSSNYHKQITDQNTLESLANPSYDQILFWPQRRQTYINLLTQFLREEQFKAAADRLVERIDDLELPDFSQKKPPDFSQKRPIEEIFNEWLLNHKEKLQDVTVLDLSEIRREDSVSGISTSIMVFFVHEGLFPALEELKLDNNGLCDIDELHLEGFSGLKSLHLSRNFLTGIPQKLPEGLEELHLSYNQITLPDPTPLRRTSRSPSAMFRRVSQEVGPEPQPLVSRLKVLNLNGNPLAKPFYLRSVFKDDPTYRLDELQLRGHGSDISGFVDLPVRTVFVNETPDLIACNRKQFPEDRRRLTENGLAFLGKWEIFQARPPRPSRLPPLPLPPIIERGDGDGERKDDDKPKDPQQEATS